MIGMPIWSKAGDEGGPLLVVELTDEGVDPFLSGNRTAVLEIYLATCPHCKRMAPIYEKVAKASSSTTAFARLEGRLQPGTPRRFEVSAVPTFLFFFNGVKVASVEGEMTQKELERNITVNLG